MITGKDCGQAGRGAGRRLPVKTGLYFSRTTLVLRLIAIWQFAIGHAIKNMLFDK